MKKSLRTLFFGITFLMSSSMFGQATDLIISEYVEGSSNNKYVELYNGTGATIDLSEYQLQKHTNGGSGGTSTLTLSGMLNDGVTYVIGHSSANATITAAADITNTSIVGYNGDDVVELRKNNGSGTFLIIDAIGENTGSDPGSGWAVAGTSNATANHTLVRKNTICSPNSNWTSSAGTNATDSEWIVSAQDDFADIASHTQDCTLPTVGWGNATSTATETNTTVNVMIPVTMTNYAGTQVDLSVTVSGGTADMADYMLNTTTLTFTADGSMNVLLDIEPDADNLDETVIITLAETSATGLTVLPASHTVTITDDECSISNVSATALSCSGDDAQFSVTWTAANTSGTVEVDINGSGYQTMTSGGTYTMTGPTTAATGVTVTVRDANETTCMATSTVDVPTCPFVAPNVVINEIDCDQASDTEEFVELYGTPNLSLDGLVIVFYNGSDNKGSGGSFDLDGHTLDANGFFVLGSSTVPGANATFSNAANNIQNGADVVALFIGDASDFPNDVAMTQTNLIDAIAYDTNDGDDAALLAGLGLTAQYNEHENGNGDTESIQRFPDGSANIITTTATPAAVNLPVELIRFEATAEANTIQLEWSTASEENNAYFSIERGTDGKVFEQIGTVEGNGTTLEVQEYTFVDATPANGINYYRLKQVDTDGQFEYSGIVAASIEGTINDEVKILPNLVKEQFNIIFPTATNETVRLNIYNINGQKVQSEVIENTTNTHTVNVNTLNKGLYIITLETNTSIINRRFVKQ